MSEHDDHIEKSPAPGVTLDNIGSHLRPRDSPRLPHRSADHSLLGPGLPGTWPPMTFYEPWTFGWNFFGPPHVQGL